MTQETSVPKIRSAKDKTFCCCQIFELFAIESHLWPCHCSDSCHQLLHGGLGSIPDWSVWGLWWTEWHWDRFFFFLNIPVFHISIIVAMFHIHIHLSAICAVKSWKCDSIAK